MLAQVPCVQNLFSLRFLNTNHATHPHFKNQVPSRYSTYNGKVLLDSITHELKFASPRLGLTISDMHIVVRHRHLYREFKPCGFIISKSKR